MELKQISQCHLIGQWVLNLVQSLIDLLHLYLHMYPTLLCCAHSWPGRPRVLVARLCSYAHYTFIINYLHGYLVPAFYYILLELYFLLGSQQQMYNTLTKKPQCWLRHQDHHSRIGSIASWLIGFCSLTGKVQCSRILHVDIVRIPRWYFMLARKTYTLCRGWRVNLHRMKV